MRILNAGPLSTVQDLGRIGYQSMGFSPSGAMDERALVIGNLLVGNPRDCAAVEMTLSGMSVRFDYPAVIALTGADMNARLNGNVFPRYTAVYVNAGDALVCSTAKSGCRGYLCVAGGIDVPVVMGSRSTNLKCRLGGYEGRKLAAGDWLPYGAALKNTEGRAYHPDEVRDITELRVVLGPQDALFPKESIETLLRETYTVTPSSDRMGTRLEGPAIQAREKSDIISDGIAAGSIQIPASGMPIILTADRQTTGGYAKIATVSSVDLAKLAQVRPGGRVCFTEVSVYKARHIYKAQQAEYRKLEKGIGWKYV